MEHLQPYDDGKRTDKPGCMGKQKEEESGEKHGIIRSTPNVKKN